MKKTLAVLTALLMVIMMIPFGASASSSTPLSINTTSFTGKKISNSMFADYDLIMLNFWAEWCGPCVYELPSLQKISQQYPKVLLIGVWLGDDKEDAKETLERAGATYPIIEKEYSFYQYMTISSNNSYSIPQTCFFDNKGNQIGESYIGGRSYASWAQIVDQLLSELPSPQEPEVQKPSIETQPDKKVTVKAGKKVTLKVKAEGEDLSYQWYYRTSSSGKWKKVTASSGKKATYKFTAKAKQNGYQYRCKVKNSAGSVYTRTVKLKVK